MDIAQAHHIIDIRFMGLWVSADPGGKLQDRFHCVQSVPYLLFASQMPGKKLVDVQIGHFFDQPSCRTRSKKLVLVKIPL